MCGISGALRLTPAAPPLDRRELVRVRDAMVSRGPDGEGLWLSPDGQVALAHRRLAVIDLSPAAAQPMASADGRYRITYNGEIYNYRELRDALAREGVRFASRSDTEVILALYAREGVGSLARLRGMYALALWDTLERRLVLARDACGIKPLYYAVEDGVLRFASQVRALEASQAISARVDPAGVAGFLLWGSVPEPFTLRRAIRALPTGQVLEVADGVVGEPRPGAAGGEAAGPIDFHAALEDSVRAHLVADVPVGVFLSAGLDSALVAALARRCLPEPPVSITLSFEAFRGTARDEGPLAAEVARALGTRHQERRLGDAELRALWPEALRAMDQPSVDGFNTFLVSRAAHEASLKVVLSGLGGDELFGSYPSFHDVPRWARWAALGRRVPGLAAAWGPLTRGLQGGRPKLAGLVRHGGDLAGAYFLRRGLFLPEELPWLLGDDLAGEGLAAYDPLRDADRALAGERDPWLAVQRLESALYLRNQLLRDSDWASMAHSLELRVPLVDEPLRASLAAGVFEPARSKGKAALVRALAPELPEAIFRRPKSGFTVPLPGATVRGSRGARRIALEVLRARSIALAPTAESAGART